MEDLGKIVIFALALVACILLIALGIHAITSEVTHVALVTPKEGVTCAKMVTSDGAAISCWKD